jgi:hypothetical protein
MCGSPKIPAPDPQIGAATVRQIDLAERMYRDYIAPGGDRDWQREVANDTIGIARRQADAADELQDYQMAAMRRADDRFWDTAVPYEDAMVRRVDEMDSSAYRERMAGAAMADVSQAAGASRQALMRRLASSGVAPDSPAAVMAFGRLERDSMLAKAAAANKTRIAAEQIGLSNRFQLYGGMRGMAGMGSTSAQLAVSAGGLGLNSGGTMTGAANGSVGVNNATFGAASTGMSQGISGYNGYYSNQLRGAEIRAANDPGNMILGAVTGGLTRFAAGRFGG